MKYLIVGLVTLTAELVIPLSGIIRVYNHGLVAYSAVFSFLYLCIGYLAGKQNQKVVSVIFFLIGIISVLGTLFALMMVNAWR